MPVVNYGSRAGQWVSPREMPAYVQANGLGSMAPDPRDQAVDDDIGYERVSGVYSDAGQTAPDRASYDRQEAINAQVAADRDRVNRELHPELYQISPEQEAQRQAARDAETERMLGQNVDRARDPGYWDSYFAQGQLSPDMQMPGFNAANQDQARAAQMRAIQDLQAQAAGSLGTQAQQQLAQGYGQAGAQQSSLGSTFRGQNAGAAMRGIQSGQQGVQRGFAGDQQMLKLQEQQAAQAMLAQLLAQQQGQDIGQANAMAQGQLQGDALNQAMRQFYTEGRVGRALGNYQYGSDYSRASLGLDLDAQDIADKRARDFARGTASIAGTLSTINSGAPQQQNPYRQVDGQDSIVPFDDK